MMQKLGVTKLITKLKFGGFFYLKDVKARWSLTDLDKERLYFAASVNLHWALVHMQHTVQINSERKCNTAKSVFISDMKTSSSI